MNSMETYFINDNVHGHIQLPSYCYDIIDSPQFQRLRELHQLGCTYFVFPAARHSRFEHCLGVGHLAGKMVQTLREKQPELEITERELMLVRIAGLCHDLGHGPFSHAFEGWVRNRGRAWDHEDMSVKMLHHLVDDNAVDFLEKEDLAYIGELITGQPTGSRRTERRFLFDVVSNSRNSVDVDKFDYLMRDGLQLNMFNFNPERLMLHCRVIDDEICFNSKSCFELYDMFHTRYSLHKKVYSHSVTKAIEYMMSDAFSLADRALGLSSCLDDPAEYMRLTDGLVRTIECSKDPDLAASRAIIRRIRKRELYKMVESVLVPADRQADAGLLSARDLLPYAREGNVTADDLILQQLRVNYALKDRNPVDSVHFYESTHNTRRMVIPREQVALILPSQFSEMFLRLFVRDRTRAGPVRAMWSCFLDSQQQLGLVPSPSLDSATMRPSPLRVSNSRVATDSPSLASLPRRNLFP